MSDKSKVVELSGRRFRVDVLSARDGSWILNEAFAKRLPLGMDSVLPGLDPARPAMTESEFHSVQDKLLSAVSELTVFVTGEKSTEVAKKIFVSGKFTIPDLEDDLWLVGRLTTIALLHSLLPFFNERES